MIVILGPTASGKTRLAALLAYELNGEVLSADSRQVYRDMNLGTGKDYGDYLVNGIKVPVHLIDIAEPGTEYNIFQYQRDFLNAYHDIRTRGKVPVLCGGSGMYLEAVIKGYILPQIEKDHGFAEEMGNKSDEELTALLSSFIKLHNKTDTENRERLIRAIEIAHARQQYNGLAEFPQIPHTVFGIKFPRNLLVERIEKRLKERLEAGMTDEVKSLMDKGVPAERLVRYGLEYRYITRHLTGHLTHEEMVRSLNISIRQFAKRQMTWFRRMERNGLRIHWLPGEVPVEEKMRTILEEMNKSPKIAW